MKCPFFGATDDDIGTADAFIFFVNCFGANWSATENTRQIKLTEDITLTELTFILASSVGAGKSRTWTIRKNGADTAATVTLAGTAPGGQTGTWSGSVSFSAGDLIGIKASSTGTPSASGNAYWNGHYTTTGSKGLIMGGSNASPSTSTANATQPFGSNAWGAVSTNFDMPVPSGFTLTKSAVLSDVAPGSGKSLAVSMRLNNTTDVLTATISDSATSATATGSQALSAGDAIMVKAVPSGTPAAMNVSWCFTYTPTIDGETFFGYGTSAAASTTVQVFEQALGAGTAGWGTSSSAKRLRLPFCTVSKLRVRLGTAPGTGSDRTITLGYDSTVTHTVVISGTNTTGNDATAVDFPANTGTTGGTIASSTPNATTAPASSNIHFGYVVVANVTGTATISAATSVTGTGTAAKSGASTLSAASAVTSTGSAARRGTSTISAASSVTSSGAPARAGSGTLSAATTITSQGATARAGSGSITAATSLTGEGTTAQHGTGGLTAASSVTGSGVAARAGDGSVSAASSVTGTGTTDRAGDGEPITAASAVTGSGVSGRAGTSSLTAGTALTGDGIPHRFGSSLIAAATTIIGSGIKHVLDTLRARTLAGRTKTPTLAGSTVPGVLSGGIGSVTLSGTVTD